MEFKNEIGLFLNGLRKKIQANIVKADAVASGAVLRTMVVNEYPTEGDLIATDYIQNIETGTPPQSAGGGVSYPDILKWVEFKGIANNYEKVAAARITKSINESGTLLYKKGGRTNIFTDLLSNEKTYDPIISEVKNKVISDIAEIFKNLT